MKIINKFITGILCACCMLTALSPCCSRVSASTRMPENIRVSVIGGNEGTVRALNAGYDNNIYISLRDTAVLLAGTQRQINLDINSGFAKIITDEAYSDELDHSGFTEEQLKQAPGGDPGSTALFVNDDERRYYTFILDIGGAYDCFISPADLAMILDIEMECDENGNIAIDPSRGFTINPARMESFDYFDGFNTVVVGDATTGEVFYGYNYEQPFPIASTTKLMTYLLTMDAITSGKIGMDDKVVISQKAADISSSSDGFVAMSAGWEIPVSELILGALLPSSNECALALGEYVGGSEDAFVNMMNEKKTFAVYFGFDTCPWCRSVIEELVEVAKDLKVKEIYYVNIRPNGEDIRDVITVNDDGSYITTKEGTDGYKKLLVLMHDVLANYSRTDKDGNNVDVKEKRIYAPNVVAVVNGKAVKLDTGISDDQEDGYMELTDEMKNETHTKFETILKEIKGTCDSKEAC